MSLKNFTILKILTVCCAFLLFSVGLNAQTVTKSSNPSATTQIDGTGANYVNVANPIAFTQSDFSQGCGVTDVNIRIRWAKTDNTCAAPGTGNSFHAETAFRLVAPDGTIVSIFDPSTYTGSATMSLITQTYDESSTNNPGGATPTGGTYDPEGDFNLFNGTNGLGTWTLQGRDTGGGDALCVDWWEITVSTTTDNTAPTAVCTSITKVLNGSGTASITASEIENGSSDLCGVDIASISVSPSTFTCADIGLNSVTLTIEDVYGNVGTCGGFVTIEDNQAPTITCPADVSVNADGGSCTASGVALGTPTTSDNCTVTTSNDAPGSFPLGTTVVTWTVEDGDGNTATCTQNVTVTDNEAPTISCPGPISISTSAGQCFALGASLGTPVTMDNCGVASVTNDAPTSFPLGNTTVTWTVTDDAGLTATCTQTVLVQDGEDPAINCGSAVTIPTDAGFCTASSAGLTPPPAVDNCTVISVTNNAPANLVLGNNLIQWTAVDAQGNSAQCTQTIVVEDQEDPTITCPADVMWDANFNGCVYLGANLGTPTTNDNCGVASVTNDAPAGSFPEGTTMVTWTVTDDAGNTATCTQNVTIMGGTTISGTPTDQTCGASNGSIDLVVTGTPVMPNGNYMWSDGQTVEDPVGLAPGTYSVTVTNTNGCTVTDSYTVGDVADVTPPTITCPADVNASADGPGCMDATGVALGTPTTGDDCNVASVTNDAPGTFPVGSTTVTWTVTDDAGNSATCAQTVTIAGNDTSVSLDGTTDETCDADNGAIMISVSGTAAASFMWSNGSTDEDPMGLSAGDYTVVVTNTDGCTTEATFTVNGVADVTPPTITCPADINMTANDPGCTEASGVMLGMPTTADDCNVASVTSDAPATFPVGSTTVTWTVTDDAGNSATCAQTVTITADCDVLVMPKVFLEGAYNGTDMNDQLRAATLIPMGEPYTGLGYTHAGSGGGEMTTAPVLAVTGADAIVDWVVVELRDAASTSTVVATRAALVQKDGDVVDVDGVSPVAFSGVTGGNYNVAIRHRNHLGAMTMNAVALSSTPAMVDFTDAAMMTFGTDAQKDIAGVMCLHAGNVSGDGTVRATGPAFINDASQILSALGTFTNVVSGTYDNGDVNMDGNIRATGPSFINDSAKLLSFLGTFTSTRSEQLP